MLRDKDIKSVKEIQTDFNLDCKSSAKSALKRQKSRLGF